MGRIARNRLTIKPLSRGGFLLHGIVNGKRIQQQGRSYDVLAVKKLELEKQMLQIDRTAVAPRITWLSDEQLRDAEAAVTKAGARKLAECVDIALKVMRAAEVQRTPGSMIRLDMREPFVEVNPRKRGTPSYPVVLPRLAPETMEAFISSSLDAVALGHNTFTPEALALIVRSGGGLLRRTKNLCLGSLIQAVRDQMRCVDLKHVNRVLMQPHWRKDCDQPLV